MGCSGIAAQGSHVGDNLSGPADMIARCVILDAVFSV